MVCVLCVNQRGGILKSGPMKRSDAPRYRLTFCPLADKSDPRGVRRLRALLKYAGRVLRLRCESAIEEDTNKPLPRAAKGEG